MDADNHIQPAPKRMNTGLQAAEAEVKAAVATITARLKTSRSEMRYIVSVADLKDWTCRFGLEVRANSVRVPLLFSASFTLLVLSRFPYSQSVRETLERLVVHQHASGTACRMSPAIHSSLLMIVMYYKQSCQRLGAVVLQEGCAAFEEIVMSYLVNLPSHQWVNPRVHSYRSFIRCACRMSADKCVHGGVCTSTGVSAAAL
jgi:hypothetical protein